MLKILMITLFLYFNSIYNPNTSILNKKKWIFKKKINAKWYVMIILKVSI